MKGRYKLTKLSWGIITVIILALIGIICYNMRSNIPWLILMIVYGTLAIIQFIWIRIGDDTFLKLGATVITNIICLAPTVILINYVDLKIGVALGFLLGIVSISIYASDIMEEMDI